MSEKLQTIANEIRFLSADMVQSANSGHPWVAMWLADIVTVLADKINISSNNDKWLNRDRLVFSWGHASTLIYSFLHLYGFDISLEELKNFRQLWSKTPGHPEFWEVPWVDITTWPLWQGIANAVWFSMSSKYAKNLLWEEKINHKVYCLCGDWDLQEWISYEACSLAWVHNLDNLVMIYDSNEITIEWKTNIAWNENIKQRFESQNWEVLEIDWHNFDEILESIDKSNEINKPVIIIANTIIWKWSLNKKGTAWCHWAPLWEEELKLSKIDFWLDPEKSFYISEETRKYFKKCEEKWNKLEKEWNKLINNSLSTEGFSPLLNPDFSKIKWPEFEENQKIATRSSNWEIINAISNEIDGFIWWSADLSPSTKTTLKNSWDFPNGKNLHFWIREHSMWAIWNAMALYWLLLPFTSTFFVFSDYMRTSIRLAALMNIKHFFIFTHDSIWVWEDWPTHQPIEQLSSLRAMPNLNVFRPATAYENIECWKVALQEKWPSTFVLSRQSLVNYKFENTIWEVSDWAYLVKNVENPDITLVTSWSELELAINSAKSLEEKWKKVNIVSMPCFDIFDKKDEEYKNKILNKNSKIIALEMANSMELYKYCDEIIGMETFGSSAPASDLYEKFGFTVEGILERIGQW